MWNDKPFDKPLLKNLSANEINNRYYKINPVR